MAKKKSKKKSVRTAKKPNPKKEYKSLLKAAQLQGKLQLALFYAKADKTILDDSIRIGNAILRALKEREKTNLIEN